ncbi:MAG TPA: response regulator transcription factor [Candidatus Sulfotelmatobacter sp.]|jgi:DNA-binding NarL/FixJ family response regulator
MPQDVQAAPQEIRIMVVDDSDLMRRSLRTLLEGQDHWKVCDEASNGQEAVTKFSHEKFDLVVLDFQMPVMDGLEAARQITGQSPGMPILMVTMHASPQLAQEARRAGIRGVCGKADIKCVVEGIEAILQDKPYFQS